LPAIAALHDRFDFLQRWYRNAVMIGIAMKECGFGQHFDSYDVFLLQASGSRRWQPCHRSITAQFRQRLGDRVLPAAAQGAAEASDDDPAVFQLDRPVRDRPVAICTR